MTTERGSPINFGDFAGLLLGTNTRIPQSAYETLKTSKSALANATGLVTADCTWYLNQ